MKSSSVRNLLLTLVGIVYVTLIVLVLIINGATTNFWQGLGFLTFSLAVTVFVIFKYVGKYNAKALFFNLPIHFLGAIYFLISAVLDFIHMLFGTFSMKVTFIVQIILFVAFAVLFVISILHISVAKGTVEKVKKKNEFARVSATRIDTIKNSFDNFEFKKTLNALSEDFKYSPPVYSEALVYIEQRISKLISELECTTDIDEARTLAKEIKQVLVERNNIAKTIKD